MNPHGSLWNIKCCFTVTVSHQTVQKLTDALIQALAETPRRPSIISAVASSDTTEPLSLEDLQNLDPFVIMWAFILFAINQYRMCAYSGPLFCGHVLKRSTLRYFDLHRIFFIKNLALSKT